MATWKKGHDAFDRRRTVFVSLGGENGRWPSGVSADALLAGAHAAAVAGFATTQVVFLCVRVTQPTDRCCLCLRHGTHEVSEV